ncbi:TPA: hypothetical protein ACT0TC_003661 [Klebsiella aerogenes]|uniref:hypothetical protein n=1 Tax=Klebsiella aerogenes TaxID=548 RepID=UPI002FFAF05E
MYSPPATSSGVAAITGIPDADMTFLGMVVYLFKYGDQTICIYVIGSYANDRIWIVEREYLEVTVYHPQIISKLDDPGQMFGVVVYFNNVELVVFKYF